MGHAVRLQTAIVDDLVCVLGIRSTEGVIVLDRASFMFNSHDLALTVIMNLTGLELI